MIGPLWWTAWWFFPTFYPVGALFDWITWTPPTS